jgi:hypothetical protein
VLTLEHIIIIVVTTALIYSERILRSFKLDGSSWGTTTRDWLLVSWLAFSLVTLICNFSIMEIAIILSISTLIMYILVTIKDLVTGRGIK